MPERSILAEILPTGNDRERDLCTMSVELKYGKQKLRVSLPPKARVTTVEQRRAPALKNPESAIERCLTTPVAGPALRDIVRGKNSACIVVPDHTRPFACRAVMPHVLRKLEKENFNKENIIILVSTGLHRESSPEELGAMVGKELVHQYQIASHRAWEEEGHFFLGETSHKIPAFIDARYVTSDVKILLGVVEPHLMAGYSGGRKLICPGLCSEKTIRAVHAPRLILEESSREGVLDGNPVHEQLLEIAAMAAPDMVLNLVVTNEGKLHTITAGPLDSSHREAVAAFDSFGGVQVPHRFKIVVTTGGGYPLDVSLYQAVKGLSAAHGIADEQGTIILAASCSEGLGSESFAEQIDRFTDAEAFMAEALAQETQVDQWMIVELLKATKNREVLLVTDGLTQASLGNLPITVAGSVEEALFSALRRWGPNTAIAVLPEGPYVLPVLAGKRQ